MQSSNQQVSTLGEWKKKAISFRSCWIFFLDSAWVHDKYSSCNCYDQSCLDIFLRSSSQFKYMIFHMFTCKRAFHGFKLLSCYLTNKEAWAVYYTVIKHDGHLRTWGKCRKHEPQASVFYISQVFSNVRRHAFSMFYTLIKHGFLTNQGARRVLSML